MKSFVKKDGSDTPPEGGDHNPTADFKVEMRASVTHHATTGPDARLHNKSEGDKSRMSYLNHALIKNRNGLVVWMPKRRSRPVRPSATRH